VAPTAHTPAQTSGVSAAVLCYLLWGLVPIYWKELSAIDPLELVAHRHVWSLAFLLLLIRLQGGYGAVAAALSTVPSLIVNFVSASLLTLNWLVYVWGVNHGHVIECSLGYFLVPLVNVVAGRFLLHEHLRRLQWLAIALAGGGVLLMIVQLGRAPWIALTLAASWGGYSLMRKKSPLGAITGLTVETLLLTPVAIGFLAWQHQAGAGALGRVDAATHVLVLSSGVITAVPLVLFAYGARRIRLSTLGLLQYVTPTMQFALGIWLYLEPFSRGRAMGFALIWIGLALYTADNLLAQRPRTLAA
jgi:chloramphenicol-sensitive protein RarD